MLLGVADTGDQGYDGGSHGVVHIDLGVRGRLLVSVILSPSSLYSAFLEDFPTWRDLGRLLEVLVRFLIETLNRHDWGEASSWWWWGSGV